MCTIYIIYEQAIQFNRCHTELVCRKHVTQIRIQNQTLYYEPGSERERVCPEKNLGLIIAWL